MSGTGVRGVVRTVVAMLVLAAMPLGARAQEHIPGKVEIAWNRYYTYAELERHVHQIAAAYPELVELRPIGESSQGRTLWVAIVNAPGSGAHIEKPAMWIDGNVHGNEIQAAEAVVYSLWYLTKAYGQNERLTDLLDTYAFYFLPSANPDGREAWFEGPSTPHSSRRSQVPFDNDRDGLVDEDPPDDLDGDGHITRMWKPDPNGRFVRDRHDPRIFERVEPDEKGSWSFAGWEGIDNDGDGRINEDGPSADDMNRNYPGDWQPRFVQRGAGDYPFSNPETEAIGRFILEHPNIAAVQSYHNTGGMILRGPGASYRESLYPRADRRVYDEIAEIGEQMLPYYRYLVIYKDLYGVHGGFVTWTAETLGIVSYTNELWTAGKYFQGETGRPSEEQQWIWRDRLAFGQLFTDYAEYDHPDLGTVLVGGPNRWSSRNTPTFMLEEECHRNFAFTMLHADQMPELSTGRVRTERLGEGDGPGLWRVSVEIRNGKVIPTRLELAERKGIGQPDLLTLEPMDEGAVLAGGTLDEWNDDQMEAVPHEPGRILNEAGIPSRGVGMFRFIVRGEAGDGFRFRYEAEKARDLELEITLGRPDTEG